MVTFKQDVNGYTDTREAEISTQYIDSWNCFNGVTYTHLPTTGYHTINGWMSTGFYTDAQFRPLVRWDNLNSLVPSSATVVSASMTVRVQQWSNPGGCPVTALFLTRNWSYDLTEVIGCHNIGWTDSDP